MNAIFILKQSDNTLTKDLDEIMNLLHTFYEKLYKENSRFDEKKYKDFISELNVPNLSEEEAGSCAGLLTDMECAQVLSKIKKYTSPRIDGLGPAFYKAYWGQIKGMVLASLNYGFENGRMSATQRKGVIVLLPKGGNEADKHLLTNYRPISLTCCDYKICASVLAKRLQGVVQSIQGC